MNALQWLAENVSELPEGVTAVRLMQGVIEYRSETQGWCDYTARQFPTPGSMVFGKWYSCQEWEYIRAKLVHGDPHQPGAKLDAGKNRVWLMLSGFANAIDDVASVTTKGAEKYTPDGWMTVPNAQERYMDAFGRHMLALGKGEVIDPEMNCRHKAQMIWNLLASLELELREHE